MPISSIRKIETTIDGSKDHSLVMIADLTVEPREYRAYYGINGLLKKGVQKKIIISGSESSFLKRLRTEVDNIINNNNYNVDFLKDPIIAAGKELSQISGENVTSIEDWPVSDVSYVCRNSDAEALVNKSKELKNELKLHVGEKANKTGELFFCGYIGVYLAQGSRYYNMFRIPGVRNYLDVPPVITMEIDCCSLCFLDLIPQIKSIIVGKVKMIEETGFDPTDPDHHMRVTSEQVKNFSRSS